ncbi:MAG: glutathione S-transferase family protein [Alphaproteobacteria bacterium]|nr:glutathione S-transferase family protein [Alphaproteobacteria bacterium]
MKFYWCEQTRAFRIAWMLEELGQPYERIRVGIRDGETKNDPDFRAASPLGKVPALTDGPVKLWDSGAICLYLADKYPDAGLAVPIGDTKRGAFLQWLMFTNSVIEPALTEKFSGMEAKPETYGHGSFDTMIATLSDGLKSGPWSLGERFTAPDVLLGSSVHFMELFGVLPDNATLKAYLERCRERPALIKALSLDEPAT